jgi:hypothetical protein
MHRMASIALTASIYLLARAATATEIVYVPVNPVFGGSPLNGQVLLGMAQATNKHKDPQADRYPEPAILGGRVPRDGTERRPAARHRRNRQLPHHHRR